MIPRVGSSELVSRWLAVTLGASVLAMLSGGWLDEWTALAPHRIWRGEVWRLVTWALVIAAPYSLILTCASIYKFGGELAPRWGDRRLRRFVLQIVVAAAAVTTLLALVSPDAMYMQRSAGWAIGDALCIAWARQYPHAPLRLFGLVVLGGERLVAVTIGVTVVFAISWGPLAMAPELVACLGAAYYPRAWLGR